MLTGGDKYFLFIVNIDDYELSDIPEGAFFLREKGFLKNADGSDAAGHGVTLAKKNEDGTVTVNNAIGKDAGIKQVTEPYETFAQRYQYIAWPIGLGIKTDDLP